MQIPVKLAQFSLTVKRLGCEFHDAQRKSEGTAQLFAQLPSTAGLGLFTATKDIVFGEL
jgi:hypothetical protein